MAKVKVNMLADDRAAPEGHTVVVYVKDEQYEVPKWVADYFVERETAEIIGDEPKKADKPGKK